MSRGWFAEPVFDIGPIRKVTITDRRCRVDCWPRDVKTADTRHDIDNRLRGHPRDGSVPDVLDGSDNSGSENAVQLQALFAKEHWPTRIVRNNFDRGFAHLSSFHSRLHSTAGPRPRL